jgi:sulfhydrogenase subunit gamma (sulfur reductase)
VQRRFHRLHVLRAEDETAKLRELVMDGAGGGEGPARGYTRAGQFVAVRAGGGTALLALTSAPGAAEMSLLVNAKGPVAEAVRALAPGDALEVSGVEGEGFPLERSEGRALVMVATRTGIAALRPVILEQLRRPGRWKNVRLVWGAQTDADFPYRRQWEAWERGGVRLTRVVSGDDASWRGARGRVQDVLASGGEEALGAAAPDVAALVVGMPEMVASTRAALEELGVPAERILTNY